VTPVTTATDSAVLVVTLARERVRNAVDHEALQGLRSAWERLESDPDLRVGVLTGAGGSFCSGADLPARLRGESVVDEHGFGSLTRRRRSKPLLAAVEGHALAGGMELVLACDLVVAAEDASFGLPEARHGVLAAEGGLYRSASVLGRPVAMQLALTGDPIGAGRAHQLGLVNELTPRGGALPRALEIAQRIAGNAPESVRQSRRVIEDSVSLSPADAWELTREAYRLVRRSPEYRTGPRAFVERRNTDPG